MSHQESLHHVFDGVQKTLVNQVQALKLQVSRQLNAQEAQLAANHTQV